MIGRRRVVIQMGPVYAGVRHSAFRLPDAGDQYARAHDGNGQKDPSTTCICGCPDWVHPNCGCADCGGHFTSLEGRQ